MLHILFDPGHSTRREGAVSALGIGEHELNLIQCRAAYRVLKSKGFELVIYDPANDNLLDIGKLSKKYDGFISLHLNASDNPEAQYSAVCVHETKAKPSSKALGIRIVKELVTQMHYKPYVGPFGPGLMYLPLKVLSAAENACMGPCVLVEAFFITSSEWSNTGELMDAAGKAGECIGQATAAYFAALLGKA